MKQSIFILAILFLNGIAYSLTLPIKELVRVGSMRENQLSGYGLVVGLSQSGDSRSFLAHETLKKVLSFQGIRTNESQFRSKNIAAVIVTSKIPPIARIGNPIDIWVSSIGDAKSLEGGYLLQTPLSGADGNIYAAAQGSISVSSANSRSRSYGGRGNNTVHLINGAIMEKEVLQPIVSEGDEDSNGILKLNLIHFDINTAQNITLEINKVFTDAASLTNYGTVLVKIPLNQDKISFLTEIFKIPVQVESRARVVIDPRSGLIVMGGNVGLSPVAVSKNGLNIRVSGSDPFNFLDSVEDEEKKKESLLYLEETPTVSQLVNMLNRLQLSPKEIIDIIKALHSTGALHAELIII